MSEISNSIKPKRERPLWQLAIIHFLWIAGYMVLFYILFSFVVAIIGLTIFDGDINRFIDILMSKYWITLGIGVILLGFIWLGVKHSARRLEAKYIIRNSKRIIFIAIVCMIILEIISFFYGGDNSKTRVANVILAFADIYLAYFFSKKYLVNNA